MKSGITEHYAHADPGDALAVTVFVPPTLCMLTKVAYVVSISAVTSRLNEFLPHRSALPTFDHRVEAHTLVNLEIGSNCEL